MSSDYPRPQRRRENPFLRIPRGAEDQIREIAWRLQRTAGALPVSKQADDDSYYARVPGLSRRTTQRKLLRQSSTVVVLARLYGWAGFSLTDQIVLDLHLAIFGPVFKSAALELRRPPEGHEMQDDDEVEFPIWVITGPGRAPEVRTERGGRASQVARTLRQTCEAFEQAAPNHIGDLDGGAELLARLYVRIIRAHPFGDGNGRTAWSALQLGAGRLRLPFVRSSPTIKARVALGDAVRDGNRLGELTSHIRSAMWEGP